MKKRLYTPEGELNEHGYIIEAKLDNYLKLFYNEIADSDIQDLGSLMHSKVQALIENTIKPT